MTTCPYCDFENIGGADECDQCHLPLDDRHLRDPSTFVERSLLQDRISALVSRPPIVATPNSPVADVLRLLADRKIGCALIVDDGQLVGIFSERDALVRLNAEFSKFADRPISQFMTARPQTLQADAKIAFAVRMMDLGGYRHAPVVDENGKPTGVISARDILGYLTERMTGAATA